jgi:hypothetical protein
MSNLLPLLPLALDAGSPLEADRAAVPATRVEPQPLPKAWQESLKSRQAASPRKVADSIYAAFFVLVLCVAAWNEFASPTDQVAEPQGGSCAAP